MYDILGQVLIKRKYEKFTLKKLNINLLVLMYVVVLIKLNIVLR